VPRRLSFCELPAAHTTPRKLTSPASSAPRRRGRGEKTLFTLISAPRAMQNIYLSPAPSLYISVDYFSLRAPSPRQAQPFFYSDQPSFFPRRPLTATLFFHTRKNDARKIFLKESVEPRRLPLGVDRQPARRPCRAGSLGVASLIPSHSTAVGHVINRGQGR